MIKNESDYKASLKKMTERLKKLKPTDLHIRYLYRLSLEDQESGRKRVEFDTENMEMNEKIRGEILEKLKNEFETKIAEDINLHPDYKLDFKIDQNQVGILREEDYPDELKSLILSMLQPSPDGKPRTKKETIMNNKIPVAFAIGFDGVIYVKKVSQIKLFSSKKLKNSYVAGTKTHKITTLNEDFLILTFMEPDMVIYTVEDGTDPTFVYNSYNFNSICATTNHMLELIKKDITKIENVIDDPRNLVKYLESTWQCVAPTYFMINRKDLKPFKQSYIDKLNSQASFKGRLQLNKINNKLETTNLTGKEIYNILLAKYGNEYTLDGGEKPIIVESYSEVN